MNAERGATILRNRYGWVSAVLSESGPESPLTRLVLLVLAAHMSNVGLSCFPSIDTIARKARVSRRAVITHLKAAIVAGWLLKTPRMMSGGRRSSNEYVARVPAAAMVNGMHPTGAHDVHPGVHVATSDSAPHAPELDSNYSENTQAAPASRSARVAKTTLPAGWQPSDRVYRWAREKNITDAKFRDHFEAFIGHARATGRQLVDWDEGLMVWIRRDKDFARQKVNSAALAAKRQMDTRCSWTAKGLEPRCEANGDVHMGHGRYLCSAHAGEYSRWTERERKSSKADVGPAT